ncbi:putative alcohol O-acetyltransferase [Helianthus annuus]|uniref:Alcohol O-acetyltransferase n=1 Tax=Helianthus annuus TaxID=4232 RepID=A0A9K3DUU8_HELAN|nr:shikimate O-hydroxycinnamoyltransferase-like [Helianthus annuus]KAF5761977.1 putative alcohol O-acetyltransferase [Helianthus annuus]KAJ0439733.1 putative alcohol O-acetyltransferase [Helianthus annuus]KAJ0444934.1 putative alcohol O-acetyltransferase [Helianthus annuus]KAJ0462133.1 putative alcohol O-acetyltransferase [Helianthus annuus]KAJ0642518.1 putative alcohol O-acetyltransferase [Helianthus annuus]
MGLSDKYFFVKVTGKVVVHAKDPWNEHWLPFTNLDLLVPPFDVGSFFCYKKPSNGSFSNKLNILKASLSRALALYYPLAGEILWNAAAGGNQIRCNNRGVDFVEAVADVELKELNLYNPDESIEGKLMPKKLHGVLAIQVTELKCGGMVIGCMFDHRAADGYSANMFISSWADIARSKTPSMIPSFQRSILNSRCPTTYSPSISDVFSLFEPPTKQDHDGDDINGDHALISRVYYIEGDQLSKLQLLASENGKRRSKLEAFTSFLWKIVALSMEDSGNHNKLCNVALAVDGRSRLSEGDGEEKQKQMASHFGNVLSMPSGSKRSQELKQMSLSNIATEVHEFLQTATTKDHFLDVIDWVEERRTLPLVAKAFANKEMSVMVSTGTRFHIMDKMDFGWGKVVFGSCHVPTGRQDC